MLLIVHRLLFFIAACLFLLTCPRAACALDFSFVEGPSLAALRLSNPTQHAHLWTGINAGAADWSSRLSTNITVNLTIEVGRDESGFLGWCAPMERTLPYADVRDRLNSINANSLPDAPPGFYTGASDTLIDSSSVTLTTANMKALGYTFGGNHWDGAIFINTLFSYDVDRSDGISTGAFDLAALFGHEAAHALGFISVAEYIAPSSSTDRRTIHPYLLDMFRFSAPGIRDVSPTLTDKYFSTDGGHTDWDGGPISLVWSNGTYTDGTQAHHWRSGHGIGLLDPILVSGVMREPSAADLAVLYTLGYSRPKSVASEPLSIYLLSIIAVFVRLNSILKNRAIRRFLEG